MEISPNKIGFFMTKSQRFWLRAARLLSDPAFFDSERERVLAEHPLLNSHGLGLSGYNPIELGVRTR